MRVIDLREFVEIRAGAMTAALVSLEHNGTPGALIATGFALNERNGFSCNFPFVDRSTAKTNRLAGAHVRFGRADEREGFPAGTRFLAPLLIANASDVATEARVFVDYTIGSEANRIEIAQISLPPRELKQVEVSRQMSRRGVSGPVEDAGVEIEYDGNAGSVIGASVTPSSSVGPVGGTEQFSSKERRSDCFNVIYGPYDRTSSSTWASSNTSVATVSTQGLVSCLNPGNAGITAQFQAVIYGGSCGLCCPTYIFPTTGGSVQVFRLRIQSSDTSIHFEDSDSGASIVAGEGFAIIVDAVDATGNLVPVTNPVHVTTTASRTLGTGEIGIPSSFDLVNGHYNSPGIVLNRVNGTDRGTSYRFSTAGGGFKDFFFYTYFRVVASREGFLPNPTACGHTIQPNDHFVALPSTGLCNIGVTVRNGAMSETTTIRDVGPWFPHSTSTSGNPCVGPDDPYWNTGGVPHVISESCDSNNAAIDLADGTAAAFGIGGLGTIVWRFQ